MKNATTGIGPAEGLTVGMDLGDREATLAVKNTAGEVQEETTLKLTAPALQSYFARMKPCRVVLEAGTHSPWVKRLLLKLSHEALVLNPHRVRLIAESRNKTDRIDARTLAELGRIGTDLLSTVAHRGEQAQNDLQVLRSRKHVVELRTGTISHTRSAVKTAGGRIGKATPENFPRKALEAMPEGLKEALAPMLLLITQLTEKIKKYDEMIARLIGDRYRDAQLLKTTPGVGDITALTFILTLETPDRFHNNRVVGNYVGMVPGLRQSGKRSHRFGITKTGDSELRRLLVQSAHSIMSHRSADGDLRRWALEKAKGSKIQKRKAVVGLARKLAVVMLAMWRSGEPYDACYQQHLAEAA